MYASTDAAGSTGRPSTFMRMSRSVRMPTSPSPWRTRRQSARASWILEMPAASVVPEGTTSGCPLMTMRIRSLRRSRLAMPPAVAPELVVTAGVLLSVAVRAAAAFIGCRGSDRRRRRRPHLGHPPERRRGARRGRARAPVRPRRPPARALRRRHRGSGTPRRGWDRDHRSPPRGRPAGDRPRRPRRRPAPQARPRGRRGQGAGLPQDARRRSRGGGGLVGDSLRGRERSRERVRGPMIPPSRYAQRLDAARAALRERGAAVLLIGVGPQLRWLTGYAAMPLERLTMLVLPADGPATLVVPRLERDPAGRAPASVGGLLTIATWGETDDATLAVAAALPAGAERRRLLLSDHLWALHVVRLQARFPGAAFGLATEALREIRAVKDADEIGLLRAAGAGADAVVLAIAAGRLVGRTEADVAREVRERLLDEGHELAEFAIVGSGPNSASPHHEASPRVIGAGEAIVLDLGGVREGYCSDTTRTLWAAGGYGEQFIHRTGHGIGLEVHEEPYLVAGNAEPLRVGHAFSIEPGIYLEGRYGARIEDIVACAADGPDTLNRTPRDLYVVSGL